MSMDTSKFPQLPPRHKWWINNTGRQFGIQAIRTKWANGNDEHVLYAEKTVVSKWDVRTWQQHDWRLIQECETSEEAANWMSLAIRLGISEYEFL